MSLPAHRILGLKADATKKQIETAFKRLAIQYHPDKYQGCKEYAKEQFNRIKNAKEEMLKEGYLERLNHPQFSNPFMHQYNRNINRSAHVNQLNNGTVLFSGNFQPNQLTAEMLFNLQRRV